MTYISSTVPNLINGISQQPSAFKLATQAEFQLNAVSSVITGLKKRPPTLHQSTIVSGIEATSFIHTLDYGLGEFYTVVVKDGDLRVYDKDGKTREVAYLNPDNTPLESGDTSPIEYLTGLTDPNSSLVATTIADQTYIINKTVEVETDDAVTSSRPYEGLVYVKNGDYSTEYNVIIASGTEQVTYSITTNDSSHVDHEGSIATTEITEALYNKIVQGTVQDTTPDYSSSVNYLAGDTVKYGGNWYSADFDTSYATERIKYRQGRFTKWKQRMPATPGVAGSYWTLTATGSSVSSRTLPIGLKASLDDNLIRIWSTTTDFTLKASDDRGGSHMFAYKGQVDDFKKLPAQSTLGFKIRVAGNNEKQQDDYFVHYADPEGLGKGVWKETTEDAISFKIKASTMPHVLIKEPDGTFHFKMREWDDRLVGADATNPFPSFIGQGINDLFFYRNRMGFLSGENVILSEVGSFWNFFHTTTLILLDSSPIDIAVSTSRVNELKYAVPFNTALMLFSDTTQFVLDSGQVLAHDTVTVEVSTRFESDLRCKPEGKATFVFFATTRGEYGGIREYYVPDDSDANDSENITSHVPEFIEGGIKSIAISSIEDMVVVRADGKPNELYIYNYYWSNKEKKQAAWHKWDVGGEVISARFVESRLVLIVNRPNGTCIEVMNLSRDDTIVKMDYKEGLLLDRRVEITTAAPVLPFLASDKASFYNQTGAFLGQSLSATAIATHITKGDTLYAGIQYPFEYRFSEFLVRSEGRVVTPTKLMLKTVTIEYDSTGEFEVVVAPVTSLSATRAVYSKKYAPTIGSINTVLNTINIDSGKFKVPVWGDATTLRVTIKNDSVYPCSFQTAEWTATYTKHSTST